MRSNKRRSLQRILIDGGAIGAIVTMSKNARPESMAGKTGTVVKVEENGLRVMAMGPPVSESSPDYLMYWNEIEFSSLAHLLPYKVGGRIKISHNVFPDSIRGKEAMIDEISASHLMVRLDQDPKFTRHLGWNEIYEEPKPEDLAFNPVFIPRKVTEAAPG